MNLQRCWKLNEVFCRAMNRFEEVLISDSVRDQIPEGLPKCFFISYIFYGGFLFDKRINKKFRIIWFIYNVLSSMVWLSSCIFYLTDLMAYDFVVATITALSSTSSLITGEILLACYYNKEIMLEIMDFFLTDRIPEPQISTELHDNDAKKENKLINGYKVIKVMLVVFLMIVVFMTAFFDTDSLIQVISITKRFYVFKFYPTWCPFENAPFLHAMIRVFQFFTVLPGFILLSAAATFMLTVIIETHNKFVTASANLRCISERTIEEMHKMDLEEEKALTKCRTVCLEIVMRLDEEREILMDTFYVDFVQSLKRYQQLRR